MGQIEVVEKDENGELFKVVYDQVEVSRELIVNVDYFIQFFADNIYPSISINIKEPVVVAKLMAEFLVRNEMLPKSGKLIP